jgi:hypothetical protein
MDLMVHPQRREVIGAHGDTVYNVVKQGVWDALPVSPVYC